MLDLLCSGVPEEDNLKPDQVNDIVVQILSEADLDGDRRLSPLEFEHLASRIPDFFATFALRV